jgi:hypothetical protein
VTTLSQIISNSGFTYQQTVDPVTASLNKPQTQNKMFLSEGRLGDIQPAWQILVQEVGIAVWIPACVLQRPSLKKLRVNI